MIKKGLPLWDVFQAASVTIQTFFAGQSFRLFWAKASYRFLDWRRVLHRSAVVLFLLAWIATADAGAKDVHLGITTAAVRGESLLLRPGFSLRYSDSHSLGNYGVFGISLSLLQSRPLIKNMTMDRWVDNAMSRWRSDIDLDIIEARIGLISGLQWPVSRRSRISLTFGPYLAEPIYGECRLIHSKWLQKLSDNYYYTSLDYWDEKKSDAFQRPLIVGHQTRLGYSRDSFSVQVIYWRPFHYLNFFENLYCYKKSMHALELNIGVLFPFNRKKAEK
ncbi:MAG TPA: hypothetical protein PK843_03755 [bacterium]|nr:hypothetical protein [bacterium]HPN33602.1 hypothetical protein [bacterium]